MRPVSSPGSRQAMTIDRLSSEVDDVAVPYVTAGANRRAVGTRLRPPPALATMAR